MKPADFEVVVVGAGHAGIEAALAASRLGRSVLVVTTNVGRIGYMSCNPSIGGLAKGHMVREVDILGGEMGRAADISCIQFKRLNSGKGPAVRGSRAQCDKELYSRHMRIVFKNYSNIRVIESEVKSLVLENNECQGVVLEDGSRVSARSVIITTGTFMKGMMFIGLEKQEGGRVGDKSTIGISDQLADLGFKVFRLKTGTPPRLRRNSIDWSKTTPQFGDDTFIPFSFRSSKVAALPQQPCYLSYTNDETHEIIRRNLHLSPMFTGHIEGVGPRYCPSIEDKITRFSEKASHQTFLEPEGLSSDLIYLQGISTSLPIEIQYDFLRTIPGLEKVEIIRPGYAVEYDFIEPTQIQHSLETRQIRNLFLAGQINGTSGYEEAAAQGLMAGVNASLLLDGSEPLVLKRHEAYIGVLIDDLITKGTREPYRMFTSRAEHRLVLREDNVLERLLPVAEKYKLASQSELQKLQELLQKRQALRKELDERILVPNSLTLDALKRMGTSPILKPTSGSELVRRPEMSISLVGAEFGITSEDLAEGSDFDLIEPVEISIKYEGYILRQNEMIKQLEKLEGMRVPSDIFYSDVRGLSAEEVDKLERVRPITVGQAQRISGVNPSAIQALIVFIKGRSHSLQRQNRQ